MKVFQNRLQIAIIITEIDHILVTIFSIQFLIEKFPVQQIISTYFSLFVPHSFRTTSLHFLYSIPCT